MSPSPREPLTRERVLEAAMRLADEHGIESLTMRRLGQALGVEAMTLYYHVGRKDELLAGIVDRAYAEIEPPPADLPWREALRRCAISAHEVLRRHPWATRVVVGGNAVGAGRTRYMEGILRTLRDAGFSARMTHLAYHALDSHIVGFTLWAAGYSAVAQELPDLAQRAMRALPADRYPHLVEHIRYHLAGPDEDAPGEFEFALDLLLDGLAGMLGRA